MGGLTVEKLMKYSIRRNVVVVGTLIVALLCTLLMTAGWLLNMFGLVSSENATVMTMIQLVVMVVLIILATISQKKRCFFVRSMNLDSLHIFFDYFKNVKAKSWVYVDIKDIFMDGILTIRQEQGTYRHLSDFTWKNRKEIKLLDKKEIILMSIVDCLTYEKNNKIYRNQHLFVNVEKFLEIIKKYSDIYEADYKNNRRYISECKKIEKCFEQEKAFAIQQNKGLSKELDWKEKLVDFCRNERNVKLMKIVFVISALFVWLFPNNDYAEKVTFNLITVILLFIDIVKDSEYKTS